MWLQGIVGAQLFSTPFQVMKQERVGEAFKLPGGSFVLFSDLNYDFSHSNVFAKAVVFAHDCALTQDALHQLFYTYMPFSYCPARTTNQKPPAACGQVTLNQSVFSCSLHERYRVLKMRVKGFNLHPKKTVIWDYFGFAAANVHQRQLMVRNLSLQNSVWCKVCKCIKRATVGLFRWENVIFYVLLSFL